MYYTNKCTAESIISLNTDVDMYVTYDMYMYCNATCAHSKTDYMKHIPKCRVLSRDVMVRIKAHFLIVSDVIMSQSILVHIALTEWHTHWISQWNINESIFMEYDYDTFLPS